MILILWAPFRFPWYWRPRWSRRGGGGWAIRWGYLYLCTGTDL